METTRLTLLDAIWLNVDSAHTPMHVGGLLTFRLPDDAPGDFCRQLLDRYRGHDRAQPPWNLCLHHARVTGLAYQWQALDRIDTAYHFRHTALPAPGGERELGVLTSRLQGYALDLNRPPWECHLIEGLENNRFALFLKAHHALVDGVRGMRLMANSLAESADDMQRPPFWAIPAPTSDPANADRQPQPGMMRAAWELAGSTRDQVASLPALVSVLRDMLKGARSNAAVTGLPFATTAALLNRRVSAERRYATRSFSLSGFEHLADNAGVSVGDIVLAVCGGGLRRYLRELGELPRESLTAGVPMQVTPADAAHTGSHAVTFVVASLGTNAAGVEQRLDAVAASTRKARGRLEQLSGSAITHYTVGLMAPHILSLLTGMGGRVRPAFNVAISRLPGPKQPLYARGAPLEAMYPTTFVTHGQALNITVHRYCDTLSFGVVGCARTLPSLQRLSLHMEAEAQALRALYDDSHTEAATARMIS